jgi:hypothetical protein
VPIPPLVDGLLPDGVHPATLAEIERGFGIQSDRRLELFAKLSEFVTFVRSFGVFRGIYIDGSFVTDEPAPGDIDAYLEMDRDGLRFLSAHPDGKAIMDSETVKEKYGIHLFLQRLMLAVFPYMRPEEAILRKLDPDLRRGILKVDL